MVSKMPASFDSLFLKTCQLLHSPDKDATDQLKAMLDECVALKKGPSTTTIKPVVGPRPQPPVVAPVPPVQPAPILPPLNDEIDITEGGGGCTVCNKTHQKTGNEIVECQECHSLYHQECHKPSLANENFKDPRFIWYCSVCTSRRKKMKLSTKPAASGSGKEQQNPEVSPFRSWSFLKK